MSEQPSEDCRRFLELRSTEFVSAEMFADAVLRLSIVAKKLARAREVLEREWRAGNDVEDAVQQAVLSVRAYLIKSCGSDFIGTTDDDLGRWLYVRLRQHATWVLQNGNRRDKQRRIRERRAARKEGRASIDAAQYRRVWSEFLAMVSRLPEPRRTVGLDYARGASVDKTTAKCGLSKRRVFELRAEVREMAQRLFDDVL